MQVKEIVDLIVTNEKKYKLFSLTYKGFAVWPFYRIYFYYNIGAKKKSFSNQSSNPSLSFKYLLKTLNIFNPRKIFKKSKKLILEHPRTNIAGFDIYTKEISAVFNEEECSFFSFSQKGLIDPSKRTIPLDMLKIVSKIISKFSIIFIRDKYFNENFKDFLNEFSLESNEIKNYIKEYKKYYIEFLIQLQFYKFILKVKKVEEVYLTVYYTNLPLVIAAKILRLKTIEVQHGVISNYHLGYHYPYYESDFFPDETYLFSEFWRKSSSFPKNTKITIKGNSYLYFDDNKMLNKRSNSILFVSQGTIGIKLKKYLLKNADLLKDYKVFFKLHPSEFGTADVDYKEFLQYSNIEIVTTEFNINSLQEECEYQIGIYSTAIYEGLERKCKTLLLNDVGIEYMDYLIESDLVKVIDFKKPLDEVLKLTTANNNIRFFDKFKSE